MKKANELELSEKTAKAIKNITELEELKEKQKELMTDLKIGLVLRDRPDLTGVLTTKEELYFFDLSLKQDLATYENYKRLGKIKFYFEYKGEKLWKKQG